MGTMVAQFTELFLLVFIGAVGIGFTGIGVYFSGEGFIRMVRRNPELQWTAVTGRILVSKVESDSDSAPIANIRYAYVYEHAQYFGKRIAPIEFWSGSSKAEKFVRKYPSDTAVSVYVNPHSPGKAVLEPQQQTMAAIGSVLFGAVFAFGGVMVWLTMVAPRLPPQFLLI
jgi:hypothetical protein